MGARERFVLDTLESEGKKLDKYQGEAIGQKVKIRSGYILSARHLAVRGGNEMDGQLTYSHAIYERFLDMRKAKYRRRRRRIHNRFIFGAYASIAKRLMYGFTEEVADTYRSSPTIFLEF